MPRNYIRKTSRASYTKADLEIALEKVKNKELTNYAASKMYGIPKSTLNDRVREKTGLISKTLGRAPVIPFHMEERLAQCLRILEKWGWGLSRSEVLDIAADFIEKNKIKNPFKNNRPGHEWFISFRKRHKLSIKKPQSVEYLRKKMTDPFIIKEYFRLLESTLAELNLFNDPQRIWNLDETSVCLDPTKTKIVGAIGMPCTRTTAGSGRENITVLTAVNAAGEKLSPLIVFKGKHIYNEWMAQKKDEHDFDIAYAASKNGWIEADIFLNYMAKVVIPGIGEERPVLIIYDGHSTHVNEKVISLATQNNVTILKLPAHTSHLLQPLDLAVFKSLKTNWDKALVKWQRENVGCKMKKQVFSELFAETWHKMKPECIQNGFKKGGIYPFDSEVIPSHKYDPITMDRWKKHQNKQKEPLKTLKQLCIEYINTNIIRSSSTFNDNNVEHLVKPGNNIVSFEQLLLEKVNQQNNAGNNRVAKRKRVAAGAEVITHSNINNQNNIVKEHSDKTKNKESNSDVIPGPSKMNEIKKDTSKFMKTMKNENKLNINEITKKEKIEKETLTGRKGKGVGKKTRTRKENIPPSPNLSYVNNNNEDCYKKTDQFMTDVDVPKTKKSKKRGKKLTSQHSTSIQYKKSLHTKSTKSAKRLKRSVSDITTSVSGDIGLHSDSDLLDSINDHNYNFSDFDLDNLIEPSQDQKNIAEQKLLDQRVIGEMGKKYSDLENEAEIVNDTREVRNIKFDRGCLNRPSIRREEQNIQFNHTENDCTMENNEQNYNLRKLGFIQENTQHHRTLENNIFDAKFEKIHQNDSNKKVKILSSVRLSSENIPFIGSENFSFSTLKPIDKTTDISKQHSSKNVFATTSEIYKIMEKPTIIDVINSKNVSENEQLAKQEEMDCKIIDIYNTGETVLTRYYTRTWKYYAGVIEKVDLRKRIYTVSFYKTIKEDKDYVKFIVPKKKDQDCVPETNIVKRLDLLQINEYPEEYILMHDEDIVYF